MMVGIYHDDPDSAPPDQLRSDAGLVTPEEVVLPAGLNEQRMPAGGSTTTTHVGPYETLGDTWGALLRRVAPRQRPGASEPGVSYEIYRNDPTKVPKDQSQ